MTFPIGGQRVGIVTLTPTGAVDSKNKPVTTRSVVWLDNCSFETERIAEEQSDTIRSAERAWAILPPVSAAMAITNANYLATDPEPDGARDYKVHGKIAPEYDIDGQLEYVWVICEYQAG